MARVSVFGLGYVGSVTAACLAADGHDVVGVDVNPLKVEMIEAGRSPVIEAGLEGRIAEQRDEGRLRATSDGHLAVLGSDISLICVGTPSRPNGSPNLEAVRRVCQQIGTALRSKETFHVVALRSTVLPGSTRQLALPEIEAASGKRAGADFGMAFNPEFLREGSSLEDYRRPPMTVIGAHDEGAVAALKDLYDRIQAPIAVVPLEVAEMVKYASNAFHALKVVFANEIGAICKQQGIDSHLVMELFCQDHKLNISTAYLKPGFAFGGSCLPKDLRALLYHSHSLDVYPPVLEAILPSNERQVEAAYQLIRRTGKKRVGVLGFSFKAGTDDLRESPLVELIERLIGKGYTVSVYDRNVSLASLHGANRSYIEQEIPHIASIMAATLEDAIRGAQVVVIGNADPEFRDVPRRLQDGQQLIDLVRVHADGVAAGRYEGIAW
jgi:GDP-mannose 6-dehydrogenase